MDSFANELTRYSMPGREIDERADADRRDDEAARRQQQALAELAERVRAARGIV
ncbi:MAG: hypothetical protein KJ018_21170 [Burkholderiales bacterium]|nr:hypothetical protein [Burkholderiales bacterium]